MRKTNISSGSTRGSCLSRPRPRPRPRLSTAATSYPLPSHPASLLFWCLRRLALAHGTKVNKTAADGEASGATTTPATLWRFSFATRKPMISKILIGMRLWEAREVHPWSPCNMLSILTSAGTTFRGRHGGMAYARILGPFKELAVSQPLRHAIFREGATSVGQSVEVALP